MGNRLTKITTRTGDTGTTGLGNGIRTLKNTLRVAVIGDIDELNSMLGLLLTEPLPDAAVEPKVRIVDLFPEYTHPPIIYPAAFLATSKSAAAASFLSSLNQPAARVIFEKYGFK